MSQKGSLLVTDRQLEVGRTVQMIVRLPPDFEAEREIRAVVIRCSNNEMDPEGLWPYQIAVEFEDADPDLEQLLREHSVVLEGLSDVSEQTK